MTTPSLTLHVDGSRVLAEDRSVQGLGWAVVACYQDQHLERQGVHVRPTSRAVGGYHEHVAFVHGVLLARELGVDLRHVTLVCDDEIFGYASTWLHPQNYLGSRRDHVLQRLDFTVQHFFDQEARDLVLQAFEQARVLKVKGHRFHPYQERADYLAKLEARKACGFSDGEPLSFEDWLRQGILYYESPERPPLRWYAPFVA